MEKNLENLSAKYHQSLDLANQAHTLLVEFLNESITALDGAVEMTGFCKSYEEAEKEGVDFDSQFPSEICITDKHGFNHNIYMTRLFKIYETFYIDGYDYTNGEWIMGWVVPDTDSHYSDLASFVESVINPSESEEETAAYFSKL